jgi:PKD repeat protein
MKKIYLLIIIAFVSALFCKKAGAQCNANFSYVTSGNVVTFSDSSVTSSGTIINRIWSFGDGGFSGAQDPMHTYAACGIYNVSLTITTSAFCFNTFTDSITINTGITPSFTYNIDSTTGNVTFLAQPFAFNLNYLWDFGDGVYDSAFVTNETYVSGTYPVCLTVSDNSGICSSTFCDTLTINIVPPTCSTTFTYNKNGGGNVSFFAAPFDLGITYTWDFGDSTSGNGAFTFHTFSGTGPYIVCLTAVDSTTMCTSNFCDTISLARDTTTCQVTFNHTNNNAQVNFTVNTFSFNNTYAWDFGDGNNGAGPVASNTYDSTGIYYVCLTTTNAIDSCSFTFCDTVAVVISGIRELEQNAFKFDVYPNPMSDNVTIAYELSGLSDVELSLLDILGKTINITNIKKQLPGKYSFKWKSENVKAGIYFLQIKVNEKSATTKLIIAE